MIEINLLMNVINIAIGALLIIFKLYKFYYVKYVLKQNIYRVDYRIELERSTPAKMRPIDAVAFRV
jgi:hypothetical protein